MPQRALRERGTGGHVTSFLEARRTAALEVTRGGRCKAGGGRGPTQDAGGRQGSIAASAMQNARREAVAASRGGGTSAGRGWYHDESSVRPARRFDRSSVAGGSFKGRLPGAAAQGCCQSRATRARGSCHPVQARRQHTRGRARGLQEAGPAPESDAAAGRDATRRRRCDESCH